MRLTRVAALLLVVLLSACGSGQRSETAAPPAAAPAKVALDALPVTIEGTLDVLVEEGDEEVADSDIGFGSIKVGNESIPVQIKGALKRSAGVEEGNKVRATLGSKSTEHGGEANYVVTALQRL